MRGGALLLCAALVGCAPMTPLAPGHEPSPGPSTGAPGGQEAARSAAIARHAGLAKAASDAGDHASALAHYEVLVLLDPADAAHRSALEATRAAIERGVRSSLAAAAAARRGGDLARARAAYLRALALEPDNAQAAAALREIEQQVMARVQADRAARAREAERKGQRESAARVYEEASAVRGEPAPEGSSNSRPLRRGPAEVP